MAFGERVKAVRKSSNLTQEAFAARLGLKQNSIALIESEKRNASDQVILAICREFGVREKWLREGSGEMYADRSRAEELNDLVYSLMADRPESFRNALVTTLLRFNPNGPEWEVLETIYKSVSDLAPGTPLDVRTEESSA